MVPDDMRKDEAQEKLAVVSSAIPGIQPGDIYSHYKGGLYVIVCLSIHESTLEPLVTYRSNARGTIWTRPLRNFTEIISNYGEREPIPRFQKRSS